MHVNGKCSQCESRKEEGAYKDYRARKDALSIELRLKEIEDWMYRHEKEFASIKSDFGALGLHHIG
jgi:hypothetical protein